MAGGGPIGVFDSGVGGLSVLREIRSLLPLADLVYVADSGHCPYGTKSYAAIRARADAIANFLIGRGAVAVVVACNTATAAAIEHLRARVSSLPLVGMEPAIKPAAAATCSGVVGVLATGATLGGQRFAGLAERFSDGIELLTQACPGLVEQVEAGDLDGPATRELLERYVTPLLARGADTLVLGCTHYPFLRPALADLCGPSIALIDTGPAVARQAARVLGLPAQSCARDETTGTAEFFSTDLASAPIIERLWGLQVTVNGLDI
ncbi:MAG: glutamate racemase [Chloroflexota bacterium]